VDWRIEPLFEANDVTEGRGGRRRGGPLPPALAKRYGSDMTIAMRSDRPTIVSNFVSTLDGVVAFDTEGRSGGREVSGAFGPRSLPDGPHPRDGRRGARRRWHGPLGQQARLDARPRLPGVGRGIRRVASPSRGWPRRQPTTVIVSASGDIDPPTPVSTPRMCRSCS